jgi:hypothetical protein
MEFITIYKDNLHILALLQNFTEAISQIELSWAFCADNMEECLNTLRPTFVLVSKNTGT